MQGSYIGSTAASQAAEAGSTPVPCSIKNDHTERCGHFLWIPREIGMLGARELPLRQRFDLRQKRLYGAKAPPHCVGSMVSWHLVCFDDTYRNQASFGLPRLFPTIYIDESQSAYSAVTPFHIEPAAPDVFFPAVLPPGRRFAIIILYHPNIYRILRRRLGKGVVSWNARSGIS